MKNQVTATDGTKKKSIAASKVLQLMDQDVSYQTALKIVLIEDRRLSKIRLEKELNNYV
jgi:hypothetical protein